MEKSYTKHWKNLVNSKQASVRDVIIHCALKAFFAQSDLPKTEIFRNQLLKSFTPITNKNKLANGSTEWNVIRVCFDSLGWYLSDSKRLVILGLNKENSIKEIFGSDQKFDEFLSFLLSLVKSNILKNLKKRYYSYIFVDQKGVEPIYQAVQLGHVAMVIGQKMSKSYDASNIYFQVCALPSDEDIALTKVEHELNVAGFEVESFYEPDVNRTIAIGTHPVPSHKRGILKNYELLTF